MLLRALGPAIGGIAPTRARRFDPSLAHVVPLASTADRLASVRAMDRPLAGRTVAAGATVSIDSDRHPAEDLARSMNIGVGTARRGWIRPERLPSRKTWTELQAVLAGGASSRRRGDRC